MLPKIRVADIGDVSWFGPLDSPFPSLLVTVPTRPTPNQVGQPNRTLFFLASEVRKSPRSSQSEFPILPTTVIGQDVAVGLGRDCHSCSLGLSRILEGRSRLFPLGSPGWDDASPTIPVSFPPFPTRDPLTATSSAQKPLLQSERTRRTPRIKVSNKDRGDLELAPDSTF